jgi:predicted membrane-bound spermidine synthase
MPYTYREDNTEENGGVYEWNGITLKNSIRTHRETKVEMVERPGWGMTCYMDGTIQSCEIDEVLYHETLVHPAMVSVSKRERVMIVGGGEGATAREVLKWPDVKKVDMYEWDKDVVRFFQACYPQWAKGAWEDPRLSIYYDDIVERIKVKPAEEDRYDVIIIDLFDPSKDTMMAWYDILINLPHWIRPEGSIVLYAGIRNRMEKKQSYQRIIEIIQYTDTWQDIKVKLVPLQGCIIPYKVYIPSFLGESTFLLIHSIGKEPNFSPLSVSSHLTNDIWNSYKTFNW